MFATNTNSNSTKIQQLIQYQSPLIHNYEISNLPPLKREPHTASPPILNLWGPHTAFHPSGPHTALSQPVGTAHSFSPIGTAHSIISTRGDRTQLLTHRDHTQHYLIHSTISKIFNQYHYQCYQLQTQSNTITTTITNTITITITNTITTQVQAQAQSNLIKSKHAHSNKK